MLIIDGKQYIEGIDGIDLLIQPYLYSYLSTTYIQLDPYNKISIYPKICNFPSSQGGFSSTCFYYLHISGEYINPKLPIKKIIAYALYKIFAIGIINIIDYKDKVKLNEINVELIYNNLHLFVTGISGIEFCFDFMPNNIKIADEAKILDTSDITFPTFLKNKLKDRPHCLIREGETTYYSYDYKKPRKSTLKLYNREIWLLKKNNEYPANFIKNNPYKLRIEFVLKRHYNTSYLTINNLEGDYNEIINNFIPYLAKLYRKYFLDKVKVNNPLDYPYFYRIYTFAHNDYIPKAELENSNRVKLLNNNSNYFTLINLLRKENKKQEKLMANIPDSYYASIMDLSKKNFITPFTIYDEDKILYKDDDFILLKDNLILPKYNTIKNDDEK